MGDAMETDKPTPGEVHKGFLAGLTELDRILRGELTRVSSLERGGIEIAPGRLSVIIIILGMIYGVCMGTYALFRPKEPHAMQILASMVKVPLLFYLTLLVTLPSLYVFNALVGSRLTLATIVRLLVASLGVIVAVLASLGPIVAFFSVSTTSYPFMVVFNVLIFGVSGTLGLSFLLQTLHRLSISAAPRARVPEPAPGPSAEPVSPLDPVRDQALNEHVKTVFRLWVVVFAVVGSQMSWVLRPFVGNPAVKFMWFRGRESNFFEGVLQILQRLFAP
jgi:hypothetical protein